MQVGDLVKTRWKRDVLGIIVGDGSLSWQKCKMWVIEFTDGTRETAHEHQLEVVCK